jgi:hypothetical protein
VSELVKVLLLGYLDRSAVREEVVLRGESIDTFFRLNILSLREEYYVCYYCFNMLQGKKNF